MCLPTEQVDRFFRIFLGLLSFANQKLRVVPSLPTKPPEREVDWEATMKVRDALWEHEELLDDFVAQNPAQLPPQDLDIAKSWKYRVEGRFVIFKELKKYAIFIAQGGMLDVFAVHCLTGSFEEISADNPIPLVSTVLLPFDGVIVADGLFDAYNIPYAPEIRADLKAIYDDASERGEIITSLVPSEQPPSREALAARAATTNAKVLGAFSRHEYKTGRSPKIVERDRAMVEQFAQALILGGPEPVSLRDFNDIDLEGFVGGLSEDEVKTVRLSLRRFLSFLRDTERTDWGEAQSMIEILLG
jgi:hypothetical protein